jgi:glutamyl-tRNA reductase
MTASSETRLVLLGWNFRVADVAIRDRIAFSAEEVREALREIVGRGLVAEGVIVSTCHRSEIYGVVDAQRSQEELTGFLAQWRGLEAASLSSAGFLREGADAARHLFRVAAGLDSMALGESEVLGQVRQALRLARETGSTHAVLHRLFESAMAAGKRVRTETEIGVHPLSVTSIGLELAGKVFGDVSEKTVLVLGAGETGALFARQAADAGWRDLRIANRTLDRAQTVSLQVHGTVIAWENVARELPRADMVVGTTASATPVVSVEDVEEAMRERRGRPLVFLDLAMPPDIDPAVANIYNVFAYALNDLAEVAEENRRRRAHQIPRAEEILEQELQKFLLWYGNLSVVPTVTGWRKTLAQEVEQELARQPANDRERLRSFADALLARVLHEPLRRLKAEADTARKLERVEAIRHLFGLDEEK